MEVREMNWRDAMGFLGMLSAHAGKMVNRDGQFAMTEEALRGLVLGTKVVADDLMLKASKLPQEEIDNLSMREALDLIDAALDLNLSEELITRGKKFAGRFGSLLGGPAQAAAGSSAQRSIS